ncbi:MAG: orotidine-5'-phosphate decarboxylase [Acidobacteriota bacterium]
MGDPKDAPGFADRLLSAIAAKGSPCMVGLDPDLSKMPPGFLEEKGWSGELTRETCTRAAEVVGDYCALVLDQVHDLVPAVKPQSAYFERFGSAGVAALERTIARARELDLQVVLDVKRGDIGSTSTAYSHAYLLDPDASPLASDAMTVAPYLGEDAMTPFFETALANGTGIFTLVRTSNPGAGDLQDQKLDDGRVLYEAVADLLQPWMEKSRGEHGYSSLGVVIGATWPEQGRSLRKRLPHAIILVPGFGAQGGSAEGVRACFDEEGRGAIVNSSRAVLYPHLYGAEEGGEPAALVREAAERFVGEVRTAVRTD